MGNRGLLATSDDAQGQASTRPITHVPFNRKHKRVPEYLGRLRQVGRMRGVRLIWALDRNDPNISWYGSTAYDDIFGGAAIRRGEVPKDAFYLDAGCGQSPDALLARLHGFSKAYRVDLFSDEATWFGTYEKERQKLDEKYGVTSLIGDICEPLPFEPNTFDVISSSAVLDLMSDKDTLRFYRQAYKLLKPGGLLSVSIAPLANGHGIDKIIERNKVTMPGWGIEFEKVRWTSSGFIVRKPRADIAVTDLASKNGADSTDVTNPQEITGEAQTS